METEVDPDLYHVAGLGQGKDSIGLLGPHYTMVVAPQDLDLILVTDPAEQGQRVLQGVDLDHLVLIDRQADLVLGLDVPVLVGLLIMDL